MTTKTPTAPVSPYEAMTVTVPPGISGTVEVRRFEITEQQAARSFLRGRGRGVPAGTYTGLYRNGSLWMSDTPDEKRDHLPILNAVREHAAERVLVNGLGLGMVVAALLATESVRHVDVVDTDPDVIALVGPHYEDIAAACGKNHHDPPGRRLHDPLAGWRPLGLRLARRVEGPVHRQRAADGHPPPALWPTGAVAGLVGPDPAGALPRPGEAPAATLGPVKED